MISIELESSVQGAIDRTNAGGAAIGAVPGAAGII